MKLVRAMVTIVSVVTFAFLILHASGDPAQILLSPDAPAGAVAALRRSWGLDQPLWQQYFHYWGNVVTGDFGDSMRDGRPVLGLIGSRLPATLALTIPALVFKLVIGVPAGIFAALHRNTWLDRLTIIGSVAGYTIPNFVLGFVLVIVFAVNLRWLASGGFNGATDLILPVVTLGAAGAAIIARFTRSAMVDVLGQPYVRAAVARGLPWRHVVTHHVLPNASIPIVTIIGFMIGSLVAGAVVVESVFSWPGLGRLLIVSVTNRDLMVVQALLLLIAASMVTVNLCVELCYGILDPRIRVNATSRTDA